MADCDGGDYARKAAVYNGCAYAGLFANFIALVFRRTMSPIGQWKMFYVLGALTWALAAALVGPLHPSCPDSCKNGCSPEINSVYPYLFIAIGGCWFSMAWALRRRLLLGQYLILANVNPSPHDPTLGNNADMPAEVPPAYDESAATPLISAPAEAPPPSYGAVESAAASSQADPNHMPKAPDYSLEPPPNPPPS